MKTTTAAAAAAEKMAFNRERKWSLTTTTTTAREIISGTLSPILIAQSRKLIVYNVCCLCLYDNDAQAFSVSFTCSICIFLSFLFFSISSYLAHLIESHLSCLHILAFIIISRCGDEIPRKMENFQQENEKRRQRARQRAQITR